MYRSITLTVLECFKCLLFRLYKSISPWDRFKSLSKIKLLVCQLRFLYSIMQGWVVTLKLSNKVTYNKQSTQKKNIEYE